jgi:hypothetical protein
MCMLMLWPGIARCNLRTTPFKALTIRVDGEVFAEGHAFAYGGADTVCAL